MGAVAHLPPWFLCSHLPLPVWLLPSEMLLLSTPGPIRPGRLFLRCAGEAGLLLHLVLHPSSSAAGTDTKPSPDLVSPLPQAHLTLHVPQTQILPFPPTLPSSSWTLSTRIQSPSSEEASSLPILHLLSLPPKLWSCLCSLGLCPLPRGQHQGLRGVSPAAGSECSVRGSLFLQT